MQLTFFLCDILLFGFLCSWCHVQLFVTPWTAARQASLSFIISWSLLKFTCIQSMMPSNHLVLCGPLLLPSVFPSIRVCCCCFHPSVEIIWLFINQVYFCSNLKNTSHSDFVVIFSQSHIWAIYNSPSIDFIFPLNKSHIFFLSMTQLFIVFKNSRD